MLQLILLFRLMPLAFVPLSVSGPSRQPLAFHATRSAVERCCQYKTNTTELAVAPMPDAISTSARCAQAGGQKPAHVIELVLASSREMTLTTQKVNCQLWLSRCPHQNCKLQTPAFISRPRSGGWAPLALATALGVFLFIPRWVDERCRAS